MPHPNQAGLAGLAPGLGGPALLPPPQLDLNQLLAALGAGIAVPPVTGATPAGSPVGTALVSPAGPPAVAPLPGAGGQAAPVAPAQPQIQGAGGGTATRGQAGALTTTPADTTAAGQQPGGTGFGFGDILNLFTSPQESNSLGLLGQGLAGFGDFLNDPQNQAVFGSLLAAGAPEGTPEQRLGAMFQQQGTNVGTGQALEQARGGQPAGPTVPQGPVTPQQQQLNLAQPGLGPLGQPIQGTIPFPSSGQADSGFDRFINLADRTAIADIVAGEAATGLRGREVGVRERDVSVRERQAPYQNLLRTMQAFDLSPRSQEAKLDRDKALAAYKAKFSPRFSTKVVTTGDTIQLIETDNRGGAPRIVKSLRNTPTARQQLDDEGKRYEVFIAPYKDAINEVSKTFGDLSAFGIMTPEQQTEYKQFYNRVLDNRGLPRQFGLFPDQGTNGQTLFQRLEEEQ